MIKTAFMELYEELSFLNEAYNIPYSGYVVVNEDGIRESLYTFIIMTDL